MARGDHIKVKRKKGIRYSHHGIDIGDGTCIHFVGDHGDKKDAVIKRTSLEAFLKGGNLKVVQYEHCRPPSEVVKTAFSFIGKVSYDLITGNCEHFATYCKTGEWKSKQVKKVKKVVKVMLGPIYYKIGKNVGRVIYKSLKE